MPDISLLIKPASGQCNMHCEYCFYKDLTNLQHPTLKDVMPDNIAHAIVDKALQYAEGGNVYFVFQGGEPLLREAKFFEQFVDYVNSKNNARAVVHYSLQTNGTIISPELCKVMKDNNFLIGVSLDGNSNTNNACRHYQNNHYLSCANTIDTLTKANIDYNVLCVVTDIVATHADDVYDSWINNNLRKIQLIPCLARSKDSSHCPTPLQSAQFFVNTAMRWTQEVSMGNYRYIDVIDNVVMRLCGYPSSQCGVGTGCCPQLTIEAQGNVYPCDFFATNEWICGNITSHTISQLLNSSAYKKFAAQDKLPDICTRCAHFNFCRGHCKKQRNTIIKDDCCAYQLFLDFFLPQAEQIAKLLV